MAKSFGQADLRLGDWVERMYRPEDAVLREIRERSAAAGLPDIQVGALDGLHLEVLARAVGARRAVEIGTLGGYSGVCLMRGMTPDAVLHTFELEEANAAVARESFRRAGFATRTHVHVGAALDHLAEVEGDGPFDLCFIDADKVSYPAYLAWAERTLRSGGLCIADNAFLFGEVIDEPHGERAPVIRAMQDFHERLAHGGRFRATLLPTGEGLAVGVKVR
ncbi:MAG TPA: O-methyltransferase [Myxococcota bacterium]|nr:O-methyltransferase [Myxococcota bacterium]